MKEDVKEKEKEKVLYKASRQWLRNGGCKVEVTARGMEIQSLPALSPAPAAPTSNSNVIVVCWNRSHRMLKVVNHVTFNVLPKCLNLSNTLIT